MCTHLEYCIFGSLKWCFMALCLHLSSSTKGENTLGLMPAPAAVVVLEGLGGSFQRSCPVPEEHHIPDKTQGRLPLEEELWRDLHKRPGRGAARQESPPWWRKKDAECRARGHAAPLRRRWNRCSVKPSSNGKTKERFDPLFANNQPRTVICRSHIFDGSLAHFVFKFFRLEK